MNTLFLFFERRWKYAISANTADVNERPNDRIKYIINENVEIKA